MQNGRQRCEVHRVTMPCTVTLGSVVSAAAGVVATGVTTLLATF